MLVVVLADAVLGAGEGEVSALNEHKEGSRREECSALRRVKTPGEEFEETETRDVFRTGRSQECSANQQGVTMSHTVFFMYANSFETRKPLRREREEEDRDFSYLRKNSSSSTPNEECNHTWKDLFSVTEGEALTSRLVLCAVLCLFGGDGRFYAAWTKSRCNRSMSFCVPLSLNIF